MYKIVWKTSLRPLGFLGYPADFARSWWRIGAAWENIFSHTFFPEFYLTEIQFSDFFQDNFFQTSWIPTISWFSDIHSCHALNSNFYTRTELCSGSQKDMPVHVPVYTKAFSAIYGTAQTRDIIDATAKIFVTCNCCRCVLERVALLLQILATTAP